VFQGRLNMKHAFSYSWHKYRGRHLLIKLFYVIKAIFKSFICDFTVSQYDIYSVINSIDKSWYKENKKTIWLVDLIMEIEGIQRSVLA
ncbi:MAG: hypothetical protein KAG53_12150, partial [Endozoicomonadaceae bacterium]|nr:hypothetical protein [Endozoicomonadaceae bacterium]